MAGTRKLRHGLLKASFVPDRPQRELRELVRYRTTLVRERSPEADRLQRTLEGANIKLASVASDPLGLSGRQMLDGLVGGSTDSLAMAELARGKMRAKRGLLERALAGRMAAHQRFLLTEQLCHIDALDESIAPVSGEIAERMRPFIDVLERLDTIPGIGRRMAEILVAEIGIDMSRFPSAAHLASWAGMCPGNQESAGKRKSGKTRKGNVWLQAALIEAAHSLGRGRGTYLAAQYRRLTARRGKKKAAVALGHAILIIVYHLLTRDEVYQDLGVQYFDESRRQRVQRGLAQRLKGLGYKVTLEPAQSDASAAWRRRPVIFTAPTAARTKRTSIDPSPGSIGGLAVGELLGELQHGRRRQPPRRLGGLPASGKERRKRLVLIDRA